MPNLLEDYIDLMWADTKASSETSILPLYQRGEQTLEPVLSWRFVSSQDMQLCLALRLLVLASKLPHSRLQNALLMAVNDLLTTQPCGRDEPS
jgi:hypothetical protein